MLQADRVMKANRQHFATSVQRLPLGVACNFRYWGDDNTIFSPDSSGAIIRDLDQNSYIDYRLAYGPIILGYRNPIVDAAVHEAIDKSGMTGLATEAEYEVAELIATMVPAAQLVRFATSGTEAVMSALRLARGFTGRDSYIIVEGSYHGFFDAVMWRADVENWNAETDKAPTIVPYGAGIPEFSGNLLHFTPFNDIGAVEIILKSHGSEVAAILIEPIMGNCCSIEASHLYMVELRRLCDEYGVLLIVDEVKTGFRIGRGGAQGYYNVRADICTFAKAMANGYPIAAFGGRTDIMRNIDLQHVAHGGTFVAHPVGLAAAKATLTIIRDTNVLEEIAQYGERLTSGLQDILTRQGVQHCFSGPPSMRALLFSEKPPLNYRDWKKTDHSLYVRLASELHEQGILCEPDSREPWFICRAHDDACLTTTLERFEIALKKSKIRRAGQGGDKVYQMNAGILPGGAE